MAEKEGGASNSSNSSDSSNPSNVSAGLLSALRGIAATLLASVRTRLELLSNEIELGKLHAAELTLVAFEMALCFGIGVVLTVALLVVLFWEQRLVVLAVFALVFLALGGVLLARFKRLSHRPERVFDASVAELEQDIQELRALTGHEPPAR
jgi:uncharacterized membrane protein YqjE